MNRLFIIGNGFDLAHGLPTSYNNFIDDFWANLKNSYSAPEIMKLVVVNDSYSNFLTRLPIMNFSDFETNLKGESNYRNYKYDSNKIICTTNAYGKTVTIFKFESEFFQELNKKQSIQNWVDIENEYYKKLKHISQSVTLSIEESRRKTVKLNTEFDQIKMLLEKYLIEKVVNKFELNPTKRNSNWINIYNILRPISVFNNEKDIVNEFSNIDDAKEISSYFTKQKKDLDLNTNFSLLLNFNYTPSLESYRKALKNDEISFSTSYIHGELNDSTNRINFGFGDEMDEDYKAIENVDDNEYLKFFKSFQYSETKRYHGLLNYINGNKFQVCILGHSCGLSDRTLLNTIFENDNCRSIKVFYYEKDGYDNYRDIIQNISRHFDDKKKMREKLVPKVLSSPFPQEFKFSKKAVAS